MQMWGCSEFLHQFQKTLAPTIWKSRPPKVKWKPADGNCFKTNFDGAIFEESDEVSIGVMVQNSSGEVMASLDE